jgi:hypothetical protein
MEGVIMARPLLIFGWLTVIIASAAILMFTEVPVCAQTQAWHEPMLEGIRYSEMDLWSFNYGGGAFYGGACPPMSSAGIQYPGPQDYIGPPPFAKKKGRRRRK